MVKAYIKPIEIAQRLQVMHAILTKRKRAANKSIYLHRDDFNRAAGRVKVEDSIYIDVARLLRKSGLHLLRFEDVYALVLDQTLLSWPTPAARDMRAWSDQRPRAAPWTDPKKP